MSRRSAETTPLPPSPIGPSSGGLAWWESALLQGLMFSLFLHVLLGLVATWVTLRSQEPAGLGDSPTIELASMEGSTLTELPSMPLPGAETAVQSIAQEQEFKITDLASPFSEVKEAGGAPGLGEVEGLGGAGSGEGMGEGSGDGLGGAGGEARFFGVEARGSRFAFVVDVSGSMMDPSKIGALQAALIESVEGMLESANFCVILYSTDAMPLMGDRWFRASDDNKSAAKRNIMQMGAAGSTNPMPGFEVAFRLLPRPDAVYFMTDGVFSKEIEEELPGYIEQKNRGEDARIAVHCITFADRGSEKLMRRIARQSGGSYTHVEAPRK